MNTNKNIDVVLIDTGFDGHHRFQVTDRSQPHLGLAYIAALLEKNSYKVKIIDRVITPLTPKETAKLAVDFNPKIVGITTSTIDRFMAIKILNEIKNISDDIITVGGGPHFSSTALDALHMIKSLDIVCIGEGEETFCELADILTKNHYSDLSTVQGIAYRNIQGKIIKNNNRKLIENLDTLPDPAWHLFDIDKYVGTLATAKNTGFRAIGIGSSRGCPYSCSFCFNSLSKKVRNHSIPRFVDMIEHLQKDYGISAFNFVDDSFTCDIKRVIRICQEIKNRNLDIKWYCSLNVNQAAKNIDMLNAMKDAGCIALGFGVEFPNNQVLKSINKKSTTAEIRKAILNVKRVNFPYVHFFLLQGLPGQNFINTVSANLHTFYYRSLLGQKNFYYGGFVQIYPGTHLEHLAKKNGTLKQDFSWNSPYTSATAEKFQNSPNQHNKKPTVPLFIPDKISLENILRINRKMKKIEKLLRPLLFLFTAKKPIG